MVPVLYDELPPNRRARWSSAESSWQRWVGVHGRASGQELQSCPLHDGGEPRVAVEPLESPGAVDPGHVRRLGREAAVEPLQRTAGVAEGEIGGRDEVLADGERPRGSRWTLLSAGDHGPRSH